MDNLVILTDFSLSARNAANFGILLASRCGAKVLLVHAFSEPISLQVSDRSFWPLQEELVQDSETLLEHEILRLKHHLGDLTQTSYKPAIKAVPYKGKLKECLINLQKEAKVDMVVMGAGMQGSGERYTPSNIEMVQVVANSPILVVPENYTACEVLKHICFVTDLAAFDLKATKYVKQLAAALSAQLFIGHISKPAFNMDGDEEIEIAAFMAGVEHLGLNKHEFHNVYHENTVAGIEKFCQDKQADILVMVHKKHSALWSLLHRSITSTIKARQHVPVLLIREN